MYTADSRIKELCKSPVGRDMLLAALRHGGRKEKLLQNPLVEQLTVGTLQQVPFLKLDRGLMRGILRMANEHEAAPLPEKREESWWDTCVIYRLLLRSFRDSDSDGVGDVGGLVDMLDYFVDLGVDALLICGGLDSPGLNGGRDVRDFRLLGGPGMGDLEEALIAGARERGIKLILELPANCTSQEHPWFSGEYSRSEYYVFRKEPNNWTNASGGEAFPHESAGGRWALRLSSQSEPELNWNNPEVRRQMADICAYWLDRGFDGISLAGAGFLSRHEGLPYGSEAIGGIWGMCGFEHFAFGPDTEKYLGELMKNVFEPRGALLMGDLRGFGDGMCTMLSDGGALHVTVTDEHLRRCGEARRSGLDFDMKDLKECILRRAQSGAVIPMTLESERITRLITRLAPTDKQRDMAAKMLAMLLLTLRGTSVIYQGQELGMGSETLTEPEQLVSVGSRMKFNRLKDKIGVQKALQQAAEDADERNWTPMRWTRDKNGGFCPENTEPWVRPSSERTRNVEDETKNPHSVLNFYHQLLELRKKYEALRTGEMTFSRKDVDGALIFNRTGGSETFLICINLSDQWVDRRGQWPEGRLILSNCLEPQPEGMIPYEADIWLYDQNL